jgi:hypothetical protein
LILEHRREDDGLPFVTPEALIPLKARAWIDMTERQRKGEKVDSKDIQKHRTDVFRLGATLSGESGGHLAQRIEQDLKTFLAAFPEERSEWPSILGSLKTTFGNSKLKSTDLIGAIRQYFRTAGRPISSKMIFSAVSVRAVKRDKDFGEDRISAFLESAGMGQIHGVRKSQLLPLSQLAIVLRMCMANNFKFK